MVRGLQVIRFIFLKHVNFSRAGLVKIRAAIEKNWSDAKEPHVFQGPAPWLVDIDHWCAATRIQTTGNLFSATGRRTPLRARLEFA